MLLVVAAVYICRAMHCGRRAAGCEGAVSTFVETEATAQPEAAGTTAAACTADESPYFSIVLTFTV